MKRLFFLLLVLAVALNLSVSYANLGSDVGSDESFQFVSDEEVMEISGMMEETWPHEFKRPDSIEEVEICVWTSDGRKWKAVWAEIE